MKYLSLFEAYHVTNIPSMSKDEFDDIKDLFKDVSDEFNLEKVSDISDVFDRSNIYSINFYSGFVVSGEIKSREVMISIIMNNERSKFERFLDRFKKRLELVGFLSDLTIEDEDETIYILSITKKH